MRRKPLIPTKGKHAPDEVVFDKDLFAWYKKFIGLRQQYVSIRLGNFTTIAINDEKKLYAFSRKLGNEEVIVVVNRSSKPVVFSDAVLKTNRYKNVFTQQLVGNQISVNAMDVVVLAR